MMRRWIIAIVAACMLVGCEHRHDAVPTRHFTRRIFFIGNSYTYINDGLDTLLSRLAPEITAARAALPGYSLEGHRQNAQTMEKIRLGWDIVVLQEQSQIAAANTPVFIDAARALAGEIKKSGGVTLLLMTWERPDSAAAGVTAEKVAAAYEKAARELDLSVVPAGLAFAAAKQRRPELELYSFDGHPTPTGSYLAASALFSTIFGGKSEVTDDPQQALPEELQGFLRDVAADTVTHYRQPAHVVNRE